MNKSKFVIVDHRRVIGFNWSYGILISFFKKHDKTLLQMKGFSSAVNPRYSLQPDIVFLGLGDSCCLQAFLHFVVEDIGFGDLNV